MMNKYHSPRKVKFIRAFSKALMIIACCQVAILIGFGIGVYFDVL